MGFSKPSMTTVSGAEHADRHNRKRSRQYKNSFLIWMSNSYRASMVKPTVSRRLNRSLTEFVSESAISIIV